MKKILIRVDSSSSIGLGHLTRTLVLAKKYQNYEVLFASRDLNLNANYKIIEAGYELIILKDNSIKELSKEVNEQNIYKLIIDSYEIDYKYEKKLKSLILCKLMVLDDTYERHYCDILLNHNIYANEKRYKRLVPHFCKVLCGNKYTLIREEFKKKYPQFYTKDFIFFVCLGGSDTYNTSLEIIKVLNKYSYKIKLITSSSNNNIKFLKRYCFLNKNIELIIDCENMAEQMNLSSFAIISPSVILYEVKSMKLPFLAIKTAINQEEMSLYLERNGFNIMKSFTKNKFRYEIKKVLL